MLSNLHIVIITICKLLTNNYYNTQGKRCYMHNDRLTRYSFTIIIWTCQNMFCKLKNIVLYLQHYQAITTFHQIPQFHHTAVPHTLNSQTLLHPMQCLFRLILVAMCIDQSVKYKINNQRLHTQSPLTLSGLPPQGKYLASIKVYKVSNSCCFLDCAHTWLEQV